MKKKEKRPKQKKRETWTMFPYRLAHHPLCDEFADHVYVIKGHKICRGCVNYYGGILSGIILSPIFALIFNLNFWIFFSLTIGLFILTPLSLLMNLPRSIKDIIRFMLGNAVIFAFTTIILSTYELIVNRVFWSILPFVFTVALYISSRKYLTRYRNRKNEEICKNCDQFYQPRCDGMSDDVERIIENRKRLRKEAAIEH